MYLVFDLDDTLLTSDKKITKYTKEILNKCQSKGHTIIINSARGYEFMIDYINEIKADYTIANGGAEIYKGHELIYLDGISIKDTNKIIKLLNEPYITRYSIQTKDKLYTSSFDYTKTNTLSTYFDFTKEFKEIASKIVLESLDFDYVKDISDKFSLTLTRYLNGNWYRLSKTTKQLGNENLFKLLNDTNPDVYTFGDDTGDLEMLEKYNGVALKNSNHIVLETIKNVTEYTNNEDGVAKHIASLLEKGIL